MFARKIAFVGRLSEVTSYLESAVALARESNTCDGGDEGSHGWDEGENPHSVWLSEKKGEFEKVWRGEIKESEGKLLRGENGQKPLWFYS